MLQRIQTIYLLGVGVVLLMISFWDDFFVYTTDEVIYHFNSTGISKYTPDDKVLIHHESFPFYLIFLLFLFFTLIVMFSYKNLGKQLFRAKILWTAYFLVLLGLIVIYYLVLPSQVEGELLHRLYSYNFYFYIIGFALMNLAIVNIGKDKKKVDSLNRLR